MAFNQTWNDAFEDVPADGDQIKFGADKIRDLKEGMRERLQIDHEMGEADGAGTDTGVDTGYHKKVTLKVATPGTPAAGYIELGSAADEFYFKGAGGTLRTLVDLAKAQSLTNKTLNGSSNVLSSCDINSPDIDGGTINGATISGNTISSNTISGNTISSNTISGNTISSNTISGGTVSSATISSSPISGSTGSFTTLAASALATLGGGINTGSGSIKIATYSGSAENINISIPSVTVSFAHGLTTGDTPNILGVVYFYSSRNAAASLYSYITGTPTVTATNIEFTIYRPDVNTWRYAYRAIAFYIV